MALQPKPPGYARRDEAPVTKGSKSRVRYVVRVARADRRLDDARPEAADPDMTGRYQNDAAAGRGPGIPYLVHINQAGKHVEGLLVDLSGADEGRDVRTLRFGGDQRSGGVFHLYTVEDDGEGSGELRAAEDSDGTIVVSMKLPGGPSLDAMPFTLREKRPTFLDQSIEALIDIYDITGGQSESARKEIRDGERAPLSDSQMMRLSQDLGPEVVMPLVAAYEEQGMTGQTVDQFWRGHAAGKWDDVLGDVLSPARWPRQQRFAAIAFARQLLASEKLTFGGTTKSALQWTEDMVGDVLSGETYTRDLPHCRELLGLKETNPKALRRYEYKLELDLKHKGLKVKVFAGGKADVYYGTLKVTSKAPSWENRRPESAAYPAYFAGVGVLASKEGGESGLKGSATVTTLSDWTPEDFPGSALLLEGGLWAGKKALGKEWGKGGRSACLTLKGRGVHPEMLLDLEGTSGFRKGVGAELTFSYGRILAPGHDVDDHDFTRKARPVTYFLHAREQRETHFHLGSALLLGLGRQQVRIFAAEWLPWLGSLTSTLQIVGYADTVDVPERNQELSLLRAKNVKQALVDILGTRLAIPADNIRVEGRGDREAAANDPDETPDRRYRRVDVLLNGHCVLTLWTSS